MVAAIQSSSVEVVVWQCRIRLSGGGGSVHSREIEVVVACGGQGGWWAGGTEEWGAGV